jgi:hypothetical protein
MRIDIIDLVGAKIPPGFLSVMIFKICIVRVETSFRPRMIDRVCRRSSVEAWEITSHVYT